MLSLLTLALTLAIGPQIPSVPQPPAPFPDQLHLSDGQTLSGRIIGETATGYRIRVGQGELTVARADVVSVRSIEHSLAEFIQRWDAASRTDPAALADLARFCAARGLSGEARTLWLRILLIDMNAAQAAQSGLATEAARAIGAVPYGDTWQLYTGQGWLPLAIFFAAKPDWRDAVDLQTAHFVLRTDLALERVLDATVQLERHYLRFYGALGPELGLCVFAEVPQVNVYANARNYPYPPIMGEESWFAWGINQLHVLARDPLDVREIVRDLTAMMLYNALRQSSGHNGEMQPWVQRGISIYFAATTGQKVGDPWAPLGTPSQALFDQQANDPNPLPIYRLLNTSLSDFRSGPDGSRRSVYAYTLVDYLLNGDDGAHREAFFSYIRQGWLGAGGMGLLYQTVGMEQMQLQNRWYGFVQATANER
jgi:hypothetical protein